jgi:glycosyltransferase involved in cell wall biosynthesis
MIIAHIVSYFSIIWKYQENYLAEEQASEGHEVHVFTSNLHFPYPDYRNIAEPVLGPRLKAKSIENTLGYTVHNLPVAFEFFNRVALKGIMEKLIALQPDIIFCHGITQPYTFQLLYNKDLKKIPIIADEHVLFSDVAHSLSRRLFYRATGFFFKKRMSNRISKVIGISEGVGKLLKDLVGLDDSKVQIIPLGTNTNLYRTDGELGRAFRNKHQISLDSIVVGYTGKIGEYKKVHYIIEAANKLQEFDICVLLVGNIIGDYAHFFQGKISSSAKKVVYMPSVAESELPAVYNSCDFLAWPAHQTISTVSASACGKPVICSDFLKERYDSGQGLGIISGDFDSFFKSFKFLVENEKERLIIGAKGRDWAEKEVSWNAIHHKFMKIVKIVLP